MKHVMIDLETMGTGSNAAIVSIGAVEFDVETGETGREFYGVIDLQTSIDSGLEVDGATVMWWLKQSDAARAALSENAQPLYEVLLDFQAWLNQKAYVWSHGASFDLPILANAYKQRGMMKPWQYNKELDTRTVLWLNNSKMPVVKGVAHNALDDARSQAINIARVVQTLNARK